MPRRTTGVLDFLGLMLLLLSLGLVGYGVIADWWTRATPGLADFNAVTKSIPGAPDLFSESESLLSVSSVLAWSMIAVMWVSMILLGLVEGQYMLWRRRPIEWLAGAVGVIGIAATVYATTLEPQGRGWELTSNWLFLLAGWIVFSASVVFYALSFDARVNSSKQVVLVDRDAPLEFSAGPDSSDG